MTDSDSSFQHLSVRAHSVLIVIDIQEKPMLS